MGDIIIMLISLCTVLGHSSPPGSLKVGPKKGRALREATTAAVAKSMTPPTSQQINGPYSTLVGG
jgi:hypothetical protein